MAMPGHVRAAFRFKLPDGDHIMSMNTFIDPGLRGDDRHAVLVDKAIRLVAQNPDAEIDQDSIVEYQDKPELLDKMVQQLRDEARKAGRPLADDLGLDSNARLLTNPEVARTVGSAHRALEDA